MPSKCRNYDVAMGEPYKSRVLGGACLREFFSLVLLELAKPCWQRRLQRNAKLPSSMCQHRHLRPNTGAKSSAQIGLYRFVAVVLKMS